MAMAERPQIFPENDMHQPPLSCTISGWLQLISLGHDIPESQMDPLMPTACATRSAVGYSVMVVICYRLDAEQRCLLFVL